jgi:hypothetical protein
MSRLAPLAAVLAVPMLASAAPRVEGRIESEDGRIEILGRPVRVGERIELPEGFLRVEEKGTEDDGQVGSFGVISSDTLVAMAPVPPPAGGAADPASSPEGTRACRAERAAYLAELWKQSGIEVSDPVALLEGLQAGAGGPSAGFYWFAIATDAFRPLAWSSALRARADALARCVRGL